MRTTTILALAALAGCGNDSANENPIDTLVRARLGELGIVPSVAAPEELCRRLTIDLWGRIPSADELAACVARPDAAARVDAAMADAAYVRTMRRAWGEVLGYNNFSGWTEEIVDLDALVGKLYTGDVRYDDFATTLAVHPGYLGLHRDDDWAASLWHVMLGRPARADEIASFRPLASVLVPRGFCEGHIYYAAYQSGIDEGATAAEAKQQAQDTCLDLEREEWTVNFCACSAAENATGCTSDVLGPTITLHGDCVNATDPYDDANRLRIDMLQPSSDSTCPDGVMRPMCVDLDTNFNGTQLTPFPLIDDAGRAQLAQIGRAFASRRDFYETEIDREARLLLGWWQTSFRHPDSDLPEVRQLLADRLRESGSVRDVQRLILTSMLYTAAATAPDGVTAPPDFAMAPTKLMVAETWLDSAAAAVGERSGLCDFRWVTPEGYYDTSIVDWRYGDRSPRSIYDKKIYDEAYYELAIQLGGCNAESTRPSLSSVGIAFTEGAMTQMLCAYGASAIPPGWDGHDLAAAATNVVQQTLGRTPDADETALLVGDMQACIAAGATTGCADAQTAVRWICQRALESTEFSTY